MSHESQRGGNDMGNLIELDPLELDQRYAVYSVRNTLEDGLIYDVGDSDPGIPRVSPHLWSFDLKGRFLWSFYLKGRF